MSWETLSKERKQATILACVLAIGLLYALYRFVLVPAGTTFSESRADLIELHAQLDSAGRMLARESEIQEELEKTAAIMTDNNKRYIPDLGNPLSWVTKNIYHEARKVGVSVDSVLPIHGKLVPWARSDEIDRVFVPFSVKIRVNCGYFDLIKLIGAIEADNPFVCVSSIAIFSDRQNVEQHRIDFVVEWPMWKEGSGPDMIRTNPGKEGTNITALIRLPLQIYRNT